MASKTIQVRIECAQKMSNGGMHTNCYQFSGDSRQVFAQVAALAEEGAEFTRGTLLRYEWIAELVRELQSRPRG